MVNDINIFDYTVLLLALIAAETAMALSLIIGSRGLSGIIFYTFMQVVKAAWFYKGISKPSWYPVTDKYSCTRP